MWDRLYLICHLFESTVQVLAEAGSAGLSVTDIARQIQKQGLRDLRGSKTPEASIGGALSRDILFTRTAPATYALTASLSSTRKLQSGESTVPLTLPKPQTPAGTVAAAQGTGQTSADGLAVLKSEGDEAAVGGTGAVKSDADMVAADGAAVVKGENGETEPVQVCV